MRGTHAVVGPESGTLKIDKCPPFWLNNQLNRLIIIVSRFLSQSLECRFKMVDGMGVVAPL